MRLTLHYHQKQQRIIALYYARTKHIHHQRSRTGTCYSPRRCKEMPHSDLGRRGTELTLVAHTAAEA
jgi:hypothetical protein